MSSSKRTNNNANRKNGSVITSEGEPSKHRSSVPSRSKVDKQMVSETSQKTTNQTKAVAKERWSILKEAIFSKNGSIQNSSASVRRFDSFGFIKCVKVAYNSNSRSRIPSYTQRYYANNDESSSDGDQDDDNDICVSKLEVAKSAKSNVVANNNNRPTSECEDYEWYSISVPTIEEAMDEVKVRFYKGPIGLEDMMGFNNTGNVCLWPSEEIMTYFCIKNSGIFVDKSVCELGGGMTSLAGLMISRCSQPSEVFLTDGNEHSFENLEVICAQNVFQSTVECCLLQWSKETNYGDLENRFDYIICADCLFFDDFREDLCATIWKMLKLEGTCLIFAPNRQNTFHKFVDMAKLHFECMIVHDYDMEVWERHLYEKENNPDYDEDLHYPLLLKLKKRKRTTNVDFCKMVL